MAEVTDERTTSQIDALRHIRWSRMLLARGRADFLGGNYGRPQAGRALRPGIQDHAAQDGLRPDLADNEASPIKGYGADLNYADSG
jgi:hypothetical protein